MDEYGVIKAVLSKDPNEFPNDFEVIAIYGGMQTLAHYKSGDQFWSYPKPTTEIHCFADVIFYKGMPYAVNLYSWIVRVYLKRFKQNPTGNSSPCFLRYKTICKRLPRSSCNYSGNAYLVETCKGELLNVRRDYITEERKIARDVEALADMIRVQAEYEARTQEEHDEIRQRIERESENQNVEDYEIRASQVSEVLFDEPHLNVNFTVFKLDYPLLRGQKSTETLNGEILFIGDNHSVSVPSSRCPNLPPNSIYYTDDYIDIYRHNIQFGSCDTGLFNIDNKNFGKHFIPSFSAKGMPPPIFVVPRYRIK
ncbi:hypothetical protein PIB30_039261 [Stylosanthes scabra]|uniref:KIB1-4 beta-propeller domain-containing protein n=1 Tax=Stylosanthes scabra TaxID=79078 RepID=A0ABU6VC55_9FABA|nr:hypothetical protein [Stylosanthes scabra]